MRKNIYIYITSFIASALLWIYINLNLSYTIVLSVPLEIKLPGSQALVSDLPSNVDVTLKGKGWNCSALCCRKN
jgi:hypothetical protein